MDGEDDISRLSHLERRAVLRLRRRVDQLRRERDEKGGVMSEFNATTTQHAIQAIQNAAAERERQLRDEIARLAAKCNRLIGYMLQRAERQGAVEMILLATAGDLHDGDLEPEPDANDTPVSHDDANGS